MLNSTILRLHVLNIFNSPYLSHSNSLLFRQASFESCDFSRFSTPFFFSSTSSLQLSLSFSSFHQFLSSAIMTSSSKRINNPESSVHCYLCKFTNINAGENSGGAIISTFPIFLDYCRIFETTAKIGGAVSAYSSLQIRNTKIQCSTAFIFGLFEFSSNSENIEFNHSLFDSIETIQGSSFRRHDGLTTCITNTNLTKFITKSSVAIGEIGRTKSPLFAFNFVGDCYSSAANGALSYWQCDHFLCSNSLFSNITTKNSYKIVQNGIIFWLDGSLQTGEISNCSFLQCFSLNDRAGTLFYAADSSQIIVSNCVFDVEREKVFNLADRIFDIQQSNRFLSKHFDFDGKLAKNVVRFPSESTPPKNSFAFGQLIDMISFLSMVVFIIIIDKYT